MSIRSKILTGCLTLTLLAGLLGLYGAFASRRIGDVGLEIYDNAVMAISYLRAAQVDFIRATGPATPLNAAARDEISDDLAVAASRAMSERGRSRIAALRKLVTEALDSRADHGAGGAQVARANAAFDQLVEVYAGDGFRYRRRVGQLIVDLQRRGMSILAAIVAAAILITAAISQLITPPVMRAVRIAQQIAGGKLDNLIVPRGRGETADLLRALATMQASIAAGMARIQALMDAQTASHATEICARNAQMEAALGNMNQGLCLFGADGALITANRSFGDMFGAGEAGVSARALMDAAGLTSLSDLVANGSGASASFELADGRVIAVTQQVVSGGGWVTTFEDLTERRAAEAMLAHTARHDALTGLPNRMLLGEHLHGLGECGVPVALLSLDLDRFGAVNDTLGHEAGNAVLREVGDRLRACAGVDALVARLGNDEFAVVQVGGSQPAASSQLADRILDALGAPLVLGGTTLRIDARIGIALHGPGAAHPAASLLDAAGLALNLARAESGGGYQYFEAEMNTRMQARRQMEQDLRLALAADQLEVFYQPLMKLGHGIAGFEALMRWRHPERGLVSPAEFIPVAEQTGLIAAMGTWILRAACRDAAGWAGSFTVAVNLSPLQLRDDTVLTEVVEALEASGLDPHRLQLEVTEGVLMEDDARVLAILHALRGLGIRIAMDDFGTGYSSLGYLRRFPFDKVKIDQSFVRHMIDRKDCLAIVRAVIGLGRSLDMEVNAEGVETEAQMHALLAEGCQELQGYLFGKPRPAADVASVLRDQRYCQPGAVARRVQPLFAV